ncbi:hypothetical protein Tco_1431590 [Tanacetum coccineum]
MQIKQKQNDTILSASDILSPPKRRVVRPRKDPVTVEISSQLADVRLSQPVTPKITKKTGRPHKVVQSYDNNTRSTIQHVQNTPFSSYAGSSSPNFYTPDVTRAVSTVNNASTNTTSKNKTKSRFQNRTPVHFDIGSPNVIQSSHVTDSNIKNPIKGTSIRKGKSIENVPKNDLSGEETEDEHGYTDRIEGISKEYIDHGDPTEQCDKCGALLWLAESKRGSTNATTTDTFSICCGRGKVQLPVAKKSPPNFVNKAVKGRTHKKQLHNNTNNYIHVENRTVEEEGFSIMQIKQKQNDTILSASDILSPPKRRVVRPRKDPVTVEISSQLADVRLSQPVTPKITKKTGRPHKVVQSYDNTVNSGRGRFCFRIQGKNNHVIGDLLPKSGETPKFGQLYIYDSANAVQNRINVVSSTDNASSSSPKDIDPQLIMHHHPHRKTYISYH